LIGLLLNSVAWISANGSGFVIHVLDPAARYFGEVGVQPPGAWDRPRARDRGCWQRQPTFDWKSDPRFAALVSCGPRATLASADERQQ